MSNALADAVDEAIAEKGYAWVTGVLQGAVDLRWSADRVCEFIHRELGE